MKLEDSGTVAVSCPLYTGQEDGYVLAPVKDDMVVRNKYYNDGYSMYYLLKENNICCPNYFYLLKDGRNGNWVQYYETLLNTTRYLVMYTAVVVDEGKYNTHIDARACVFETYNNTVVYVSRKDENLYVYGNVLIIVGVNASYAVYLPSMEILLTTKGGMDILAKSDKYVFACENKENCDEVFRIYNDTGIVEKF